MAISKIAAAAITDNSITATDIGADAVAASELADNAVDTAAIQANAVTSVKVDTSVANTGRNVAMSMIFGSYQ